MSLSPQEFRALEALIDSKIGVAVAKASLTIVRGLNHHPGELTQSDMEREATMRAELRGIRDAAYRILVGD